MSPMAEQCTISVTDLSKINASSRSSPIAINAIIQRPGAYLTPVELDLGETFLQVPVLQQFELQPINELPTQFLSLIHI